MDYYKFFSTDDLENKSSITIGNQKSVVFLDNLLKKLLDFEKEVISYEDIPFLIQKFQTLKHFEYKSPIYFTLGYLCTKHDWNVVWEIQDWISKWIGIPLEQYHTIRYKYLNCF